MTDLVEDKYPCKNAEVMQMRYGKVVYCKENNGYEGDLCICSHYFYTGLADLDWAIDPAEMNKCPHRRK